MYMYVQLTLVTRGIPTCGWNTCFNLFNLPMPMTILLINYKVGEPWHLWDMPVNTLQQSKMKKWVTYNPTGAGYHLSLIMNVILCHNNVIIPSFSHTPPSACPGYLPVSVHTEYHSLS